MRLIDADALLDKLICTYRYFTVKGDIQEAPTIDAVPVVRCDNCCHRYENEEGVYVCSIWLDAPCGDDDFCSYGERREKQ